MFNCRWCGTSLIEKDNGWICPNENCKDKRWPYRRVYVTDKKIDGISKEETDSKDNTAIHNASTK